MSQHSSLSSGKRKKRHRSVLKRFERLKHMKEKDEWEEGKASIFGLPKIKVVKFRVKKEKVAEEVPAEGAEVQAGAEGEAAAKATAGAQEGKGKVAEKVKEKDASKKDKKEKKEKK